MIDVTVSGEVVSIAFYTPWALFAVVLLAGTIWRLGERIGGGLYDALSHAVSHRLRTRRYSRMLRRIADDRVRARHGTAGPHDAE